MVLIYGYLEKSNGKVLKFHMNNSSYFEKTPPTFKYPFQLAAHLKTWKLDKSRDDLLQ